MRWACPSTQRVCGDEVPPFRVARDVPVSGSQAQMFHNCPEASVVNKTYRREDEELYCTLVNTKLHFHNEHAIYKVHI